MVLVLGFLWREHAGPKLLLASMLTVKEAAEIGFGISMGSW